MEVKFKVFVKFKIKLFSLYNRPLSWDMIKNNASLPYLYVNHSNLNKLVNSKRYDGTKNLTYYK